VASDAHDAPNRRDAAHEGVEREVILIHFRSAKYLRLDAAGKVAWAAIERRAAVDDVVDALGHAFDVAAPLARECASSFLASLLEHDLIVPEAHVTGPTPSDPAPPAVRSAFLPLRLEVFSDLEDLFLVDSSHDVDESGWPQVAP